ncbi:hypothetical protein BGZ97_005315 [Linnemannia gamsii]|uniref:C3H1-type domain-containing protein n=1 Tax=Linnemannia gamsii TaxID=64522 RepID=A0A9P6QSN0_9FUNG|nr:hypothetical protein BGZ97_005315 [Linnemannia gamsii]
MAKIQLGTPQEKELTTLVLEKLNDFGWADNDVLANFIVVMVANEKSKDEIVAELNDILPGQATEFADWLFEEIDIRYGDGMALAPVAQQVVSEVEEQSAEAMDTTTTRSRPSEPRSAGRLLQTAISSATRAEPAAAHRQAPTRVYGGEKRERRESREKSTSPIRSREGLTTRGKEERIRFRRTDDEVSRDEARVASRLGIRGGRDGSANGRADPLRGRLGRIEDRLGKREDVNPRRQQQRDRSWDNGNDYHDRRNDRNNGRTMSKEAALRDIERRLGTRPVTDRPGSDSENDEDTPRQPASWTRDPERMFRLEAEQTRKAIELESAGISRCKFWPSCSQGENCQFWHPKTVCMDFPNCSKTANTCLYIHPYAEPTAEQLAAAARQALMDSMRNNTNPNGTPLNAMQMPFPLGTQRLDDCKFGARCTRVDCKFRHPEGTANQQPQQLCRFYPHCTKPNCPFSHPTATDASQDSSMDIAGAAADGQEAVNRIPVPCRFGDQCTRPGCHFTHPRDGAGASSSMPLCKFNPCTRPGCSFRHAPGAQMAGGIGQNRSLILNGVGAKPKMSERFSGGVAADGEVEKLHVPASVYWSGSAPNRVTTNDGSTAAAPRGQAMDQAEMEAAELAAAAEMDMDMDAEL